MSEFKVSSMESSTGGAPSFTQGLNVAGADVTSGHGMSEYYTGATEPSSPANGAFWWNGTDLHQYINGKFRILDVTAPPTNIGSRGVFAGGANSSGNTTDVIDYIAIPTAGNATDFGNLTPLNGRYNLASCSNGTRGLFGGGASSGVAASNVIDYVTIASAGNATDFGNLTVARHSLAGCSNGTRGLFGGGSEAGVAGINTIDYVTIASTGNATDFGDLSNGLRELASCSNTTRGIFAGGRGDSTSHVPINVIQYVTIASAGNATDFGDLTSVNNQFAACANDTRGLFGGGVSASAILNIIDYITIDTTGNATDFGDLLSATYSLGAAANSTRGVFSGGAISGKTNVMAYVTIATTGNATDFGDLTVARNALAGCSGD